MTVVEPPRPWPPTAQWVPRSGGERIRAGSTNSVHSENRGIGYAVDTRFQVLNAIVQSGADNKQWDTLYTMAVKACGLATQFTQPGVCREAIADGGCSQHTDTNWRQRGQISGWEG